MTQRKNNQKKFEQLRIDYPLFIYRNYTYSIDTEKETIDIEFEFECGEFYFKPTLNFSIGKSIQTITKPEDLSVLVFNIGMVELISYWKAFASPILIIETGALTDSQIAFWKKLYFNGLGEYFYLNKIETTLDNFMTIVPTGREFAKIKSKFSHNQNRVIVPIGGGKDSAVTFAMLRQNGFDTIPLIINPRKANTDTLLAENYKGNQLTIIRVLDTKLLELNEKGYLNGHTPFSALLAFATLLPSFALGVSDIALSNENSANESTVKGQDINHQYSKSFEFEQDFRAYVKEFISEGFNYFSFLRPLAELQIAQLFSTLTQFHPIFRSCNVGSKTNSWCCNCPKCLFAYLILSPFISQEKLTKYFGADLLNAISLHDTFDQLIGKAKVKPFECIGTIEEVNLAIALTIENFPQTKNQYFTSYWKEFCNSTPYLEMDKSKFLYTLSQEHNLLNKYLSILNNHYAIYKKAELIRLLADKQIIIFGLGKEGASTYQLFKKLFPHKKLLLQDSNTNLSQDPELMEALSQKKIKLYLGEQSQRAINQQVRTNIVIKSPGIANSHMEKPYKEQMLSSQTDLFLRLYGSQCIGVTGTKGKSTTSTLIYNIIKAKHKDTLLAGNIGVPMFDLIDKITPNTIIVLELSAHQLQYIKQSPKVSVLLNLYEEHLDHFESFEDYQKAKLNIIKYQEGKENAFIYNANDKLISQWIKKLNPSSTLIPIDVKDYEFEEPKFLKGEHNKFNIMLAYEAAKFLKTESKKGLNQILEFKGLEHRLEFVGTINKIDYYNDSISTIPQTTISALNSLEGVQTIILGGKDRGIDYSVLQNILYDYKDLKNIVFVGKAGEKMQKLIKQNPKKKSLFLISNNYNEIVAWCKQVTSKGKKVLLSPAASSYDSFKNFEERGKVFKQLVLKEE